MCLFFLFCLFWWWRWSSSFMSVCARHFLVSADVGAISHNVIMYPGVPAGMLYIICRCRTFSSSSVSSGTHRRRMSRCARWKAKMRALVRTTFESWWYRHRTALWCAAPIHFDQCVTPTTLGTAITQTCWRNRVRRCAPMIRITTQRRCL